MVSEGNSQQASEDGSVEDIHRVSSGLSANWISRLTLWWLGILFKRGYRRPLRQSDLPETLPQYESALLAIKLQSELSEFGDEETEGDTSGWHLAKALFTCFKKELIINGITSLFMEILKLSQPVLVGWLVDYLVDNTQTSPWPVAAALVLISFLYSLPYSAAFHGQWCVALQAKVACSALLYRKVLKASVISLSRRSRGQIINLLSSDVEKFNMGLLWLHYMWLAPVEALVIIGLLFRECGIASFTGVAAIVVLVAAQQAISVLIGKTRIKVASSTDKRVQQTNEVINGIKPIKMLAWEQPLGAKIHRTRKSELFQLWKTQTLRGQNNSLYFVSGKVTLFLLVVTMFGRGMDLPLSAILRTLAWLEMARVAVFMFLPDAFSNGLEMFASIKRIQEFLMADDQRQTELALTDSVTKLSGDRRRRNGVVPSVPRIDPAVSTYTNPGYEEDEGPGTKTKTGRRGSGGKSRRDRRTSITLTSVTSSWTPPPSPQPGSETQKIAAGGQNGVVGVSVSVSTGDLIALIGGVGSGKSTLLRTMMGEIPVLEGGMETCGQVSYSPQDPWVFSGTIRDNITFGSSFIDEERYQVVFQACGLQHDVKDWPDGDNAMVGDRGAKLSGGQRARLSFARAVYRKADIYLFDDPLCMVDKSLADNIFNRCIKQILKGTTRILVTNHAKHLPHVDKIWVLEKGIVIMNDTFEALKERTSFMDLLSSTGNENEPLIASATTISDIVKKVDRSLQGTDTPLSPEKRSAKKHAQLYMKYFFAGSGVILAPVYFLLSAATQVFYILADWWLTSCFQDDKNTNDTRLLNTTVLDSNDIYSPCNGVGSLHGFLIIYSILLVLLVVGSALKEFILNIFTTLASYRLHRNMLTTLLSGNMKYFSLTPLGGLINNFSRDLNFIDDLLPHTLRMVLNFIFILSGIGVLAVVNCPWVLLVLAPVLVVCVALQRYTIRTSNQLKRLEAQAKSPTYSHLSLSLDGMSVIRAFEEERRLITEFDRLQDSHTTAWYLYISCSRWLGMRLDWVTSVFLAGVVVTALLLRDSIDGPILGMTLTYIIMTMGLLQFMVRESTQLDSLMTSVELVNSYSEVSEDLLEMDRGSSIEKLIMPRFDQGGIKLDNVSLSYGKDAVAIKDVSFYIQPKQKCAVVGRTGAGKSSLLSVLLRMWKYEGRVTIGGIDMSRISVKNLRQGIAVVPQEPMFFTGTIRENLDIQENRSDEELWKVLDKVAMKDKVEKLSGALSEEVREGGNNFSMGERQLLCLARALLIKSNILLMDEATANLDHGTESTIKEAVEKCFHDCTVFLIAHRLQTVLNCDIVLVVDDGRIAERGHPKALILDKSSRFHKLFSDQNSPA